MGNRDSSNKGFMGRHQRATRTARSSIRLIQSICGWEAMALSSEQTQHQAPVQPWTLIRGWVKPDAAVFWRDQLAESVGWKQPIVRVYGRQHPVPRLTAFLAETGVRYRYSGTQHTGSGWPDWFVPLLKEVKQACFCNFNGCLLNLYRHGDDRMGWHADDEPEIDQSSPIASLSFGASRDFQLRHRHETGNKTSLSLADGDLLIMQSGCQQSWQHCIPQRKKIRTMRLNLTFRRFQMA